MMPLYSRLAASAVLALSFTLVLCVISLVYAFVINGEWPFHHTSSRNADCLVRKTATLI